MLCWISFGGRAVAPIVPKTLWCYAGYDLGPGQKGSLRRVALWCFAGHTLVIRIVASVGGLTLSLVLCTLAGLLVGCT